MMLMAVFMGTTSAVLCSLFGQLQRGCWSEELWHHQQKWIQIHWSMVQQQCGWNSTAIDDFLTVLLNVTQMLAPHSFISGLFKINYYTGNHRRSSFYCQHKGFPLSTLQVKWHYTEYSTITLKLPWIRFRLTKSSWNPFVYETFCGFESLDVSWTSVALKHPHSDFELCFLMILPQTKVDSVAEFWTGVTWLIPESDPSHEDLQLDFDSMTMDLGLLLEFSLLTLNDLTSSQRHKIKNCVTKNVCSESTCPFPDNRYTFSWSQSCCTSRWERYVWQSRPGAGQQMILEIITFWCKDYQGFLQCFIVDVVLPYRSYEVRQLFQLSSKYYYYYQLHSGWDQLGQNLLIQFSERMIG